MKELTDFRFARVLLIGAHFDDETLFAGGTLKRLSDQNCEIGIAVAASVTVTNKPHHQPLRIENESARQARRLVAFGRVCGMLNATRIFMLETHNCRTKLEDEGPDQRVQIRDEITERIGPVINDFQPDAVITHGPSGEYGHGQHILTHQAVRGRWPGPLWCFDSAGPTRVEIDLDFKKRLLDCYRYGTTQDVYWTPYWRSDPATKPWLGDTECFRLL